jgi:hypothetical protein
MRDHPRAATFRLLAACVGSSDGIVAPHDSDVSDTDVCRCVLSAHYSVPRWM